ncbi:MAG: transglutaminase-like domain-containing protein [Candidatus Cyclobacteriaceae bacterium M2_1C_046]
MKNLLSIVSALLIILTSCQPDAQVEEGNRNTEHSENKTTRTSIAEIEEGIRTYIKNETIEENGYFHINDEDRNLRLKLVRVHTEYLSNLGPKRHFACVDLADVSGDVYDVDFFLSGDPGDMSVTETTVHKLNGKPFYAWKQKEDKTWHRIPVKEASSELLGVIEGEDEFEFRYEVKLPEITEEAKIWIPVAQSDDFQTVDLIKLKARGKQQMLEDKEFGNTILYLELNPAHSGQSIELIYNVKRKEKGPYKEPNINPEMYLGSSNLIPVGGRFTSISDEVFLGKQGDSELMKARALYDYIIDNMKYRKAGLYGTGDANYACDSRSGNCTEFHSFFISLARSAGIPARFAIGAAIPSERNEGGVNGYHCWAEFYAEGKWWPVDISEANKYTALATYYFGHHPANRIEFSRGRDLVVEPGPISGPIKFLAYPVLETRGEVTTAETDFSFTRKAVKPEETSI